MSRSIAHTLLVAGINAAMSYPGSDSWDDLGDGLNCPINVLDGYALSQSNAYYAFASFVSDGWQFPRNIHDYAFFSEVLYPLVPGISINLWRKLDNLFDSVYSVKDGQIMVSFYTGHKDRARDRKTTLRLTRFLSRMGLKDSDIQHLANKIETLSQFMTANPDYTLAIADNLDSAIFATQSFPQGYDKTRESRERAQYVGFGSISPITHTILSCQRYDNPARYLSTNAIPFQIYIQPESDVRIAYMTNPDGFLCARALVSFSTDLGTPRANPLYFKIYADCEYSARQFIQRLESDHNARKGNNWAGSVVPAMICPDTGRLLCPYSDSLSRIRPYSARDGFLQFTTEYTDSCDCQETSGLLTVGKYAWPSVYRNAKTAIRTNKGFCTLAQDAEESESCHECGDDIDPDESIHHRGNCYCDNCYYELFFVCENCGDVESVDDQTYLRTSENESECMCNYCARQNGTISALSGDMISDSEIVAFLNPDGRTVDAASWEAQSRGAIEVYLEDADAEYNYVWALPDSLHCLPAGSHILATPDNTRVQYGVRCYCDESGMVHFPLGRIEDAAQLELPL